MQSPEDSSSPPLAITYLTDVEGRWDKIESFVKDNPLISLDAQGRLRVQPGARFVFGGDAVDRGPDARKVVRALLEARRAQPSQVVLLAGNRDINKLRFSRELSGKPLARTPPEVARAGGPTLVRWLLANTMGAREAFDHRQVELARELGRPASEDEVFESFRADVAPGGELRAYLNVCALAHREGDALFVHGGVCDESFGVVPTGAVSDDERHAEYRKITDDLNTWVAELNAFYARQMQAFEQGAETVALSEPAPWAAIVAYQAPIAGTRANASSVVYGRTTDALGNPRLPPRAVIDRLGSAGVHRVLVGHSPAGDCPAVLRFEGFSMVFADNSYARTERGSQVYLLGDRTIARGECVTDDGRAVRTHAEWTPRSPGPLGMQTQAERALVKAQSDDGAWVLFRAREGYVQEQRLCAPEALGPVEPAFD